ncbi:MAG: glycosyltransferase family 4 protein, partial [Hyphomicrobiales bacterium]|nr:glycosyltransferase family 4 protein [Hyphomicrobiales bacterium]
MSGLPPLRLTLLLEDLDFGGTQRYAVNLLSHIDREKLAPTVWTLRGGDDFRPAIQGQGIPVIDMTKARKVGVAAIVRLALTLVRDRPDVLYTLTVLPCIWGRLFAGLMGITVVSGYRNHLPQQHERLLHRFSRRIIANAERLKDVLTTRFSVPEDRVAVIPNGVDTDHFRPDRQPDPSKPIIVCIARRVGRKDLPTLIEAFAILRRSLPQAKLRIVGNGPVALAGQENVEVLAAASDIRPFLRDAAVFALSSVDEGAPNVILEAMASGLP